MDQKRGGDGAAGVVLPSTQYSIPFNRSSTLGKELQYIAETLSRGQIAGDQAFTRRCQALLEDLTGACRVLLTTSCTHALEMAACCSN